MSELTLLAAQLVRPHATATPSTAGPVSCVTLQSVVGPVSPLKRFCISTVEGSCESDVLLPSLLKPSFWIGRYSWGGLLTPACNLCSLQAVQACQYWEMDTASGYAGS